MRSGGYASKQDVPLYFNALAGSAAGIAYWGIPYPADSIKSRIQTDPTMAQRGFFDVGAWLSSAARGNLLCTQ